MVEQALSFLIDAFGEFVDALNGMHLVRGISVLGIFLGALVVGFVISFIFRK